MKKNELRTLYLSGIRLYGYLLDTDIFNILDHYGIEVDKETIYKDLADRYKRKNDYQIYYMSLGKKRFALLPFDGDDDLVQKLAKAKGNKPFYYPKRYEDFIKYADEDYFDENQSLALDELSRFLNSKFKIDDKSKLYGLAFYIIDILETSFGGEGLYTAIDVLDRYDLHFDSEKDIEKYVALLQKTANNLRTPYNNGFTPHEMARMMPKASIDKMQLTLGPNIRNSLLNGDIDPLEMMKQIDTSNIPKMAKESLKKELRDIIIELGNNKA